MDWDKSKQSQLTDEKYLAKYHVLTYMQDAVNQLLEHREDNPQVVPAKFLNDYFQSITKGNHTLFREYSFIHETPHNRASFIGMFWKCFKHIGSNGDLLSVNEYHSLLALICPDFPLDTVQKSARIVLMDDAMDCLMSFSDFCCAFQVQFYYEEFICECKELYDEVCSGSHRPGQVVVVPTSHSKSGKHHKNRDKGNTSQETNQSSSEGVDSETFYDDIRHHIVHNYTTASSISIPPTVSLQQIFSSANRVTFYGFLMALAKNDLVSHSIGAIRTTDETTYGAVPFGGVLNLEWIRDLLAKCALGNGRNLGTSRLTKQLDFSTIHIMHNEPAGT